MLQVNNASVFFKQSQGQILQALNHVSFCIPDKGFVVALGSSGCGKSTLLNALAGFLPLSEGSITLNGKIIEGPSANRGVVFQKDTLLPWSNVLDNVALGLKFAGYSKKERRDKAQHLLELVGLEDFADSKPYELSGGMRQRVGLARALAPNPDVLLMDEPFGALDSMTREQMQELLIDVWDKTGKQIFFITHSIEEALFLGTEILVMSPRPGRVIETVQCNFVNQYVTHKNSKFIKSLPEFQQHSDHLRAVIHQTESIRYNHD